MLCGGVCQPQGCRLRGVRRVFSDHAPPPRREAAAAATRGEPAQCGGGGGGARCGATARRQDAAEMPRAHLGLISGSSRLYLAADPPGLSLFRDARHTSGYYGVYKNGTRWVAKVSTCDLPEVTRRTAPFSNVRCAAGDARRRVAIARPDVRHRAGRRDRLRAGDEGEPRQRAPGRAADRRASRHSDRAGTSSAAGPIRFAEQFAERRVGRSSATGRRDGSFAERRAERGTDPSAGGNSSGTGGLGGVRLFVAAPPSGQGRRAHGRQ